MSCSPSLPTAPCLAPPVLAARPAASRLAACPGVRIPQLHGSNFLDVTPSVRLLQWSAC